LVLVTYSQIYRIDTKSENKNFFMKNSSLFNKMIPYKKNFIFGQNNSSGLFVYDVRRMERCSDFFILRSSTQSNIITTTMRPSLKKKDYYLVGTKTGITSVSMR
jgi:hypothetical protein